MPYSTASPRQNNRHLSEIINVCPDHDHACVGIAVTRGRRCQASTNAMNRAHANRLLDEGTRLLQSGQRNIDDILEELAPLLLCRRWHQSQAAEVVREWSKEVQNDQRRSRNQPVSLARGSRESSTPSSFATDIRYSTSPYTSRNESLESIAVTLELLVQLLQRSQTVPVSANTSSRASEGSRGSISRPPSSAEHVVRTNEQASNATRQVRGNNQRVNTSSQSSTVASETPTTTQHMRPRTPVLFSPTAETSNRQPQRRAQPGRRQVVRKPIEGECHICFLSLRDEEVVEEEEEEEQEPQTDNTATTDSAPNDSDEETLVWCRSQCGYNFHKTCLDTWTNSQHEDHRAATCPMCRAQWVMQ
jgi:Anaphase-promoting complex subunit 11 RING-H2 finger